jgi:CubicO group peptidase (beta-lactamase class C family)
LSVTLDETIAAARRRYGIRAISLAVIASGRTVVMEGFGAKADTPFAAASLSKPVFAAAVLEWAAAMRMDLDRPLPGAPQGVTLRRLLSHSAGYGNGPVSKEPRLRSPPGERWLYSGEGYYLLQLYVEAATRKPADAFARQWLFAHLGMKRSAFGSNASSTLTTTVEDFASFLRALFTSRRELARRMMDPVADTGLGVQWGLGWALPERDWFFHWGSLPGARCWVAGQREAGNALVYFTDSDNGLKALPELMAAVFGAAPRWLRFPPLAAEL